MYVCCFWLTCATFPHVLHPPGPHPDPLQPTSGLDSVTALSLVTTLRELSRSHHCTVLCTIHQPSAKIFSLFDTLILLQARHRCAALSCAALRGVTAGVHVAAVLKLKKLAWPH